MNSVSRPAAKARLTVAVLASAALTTAVALYVSGLWESDDPVEATPAAYGIYNVSVSHIPEGVKVTTPLFPVPEGLENTPVARTSLYLVISVPLSPDEPRSTFDPETGYSKSRESRVVIDADTGEVVLENYKTPAEEAMLGEALAKLSVGPWEPAKAAWPRTDTEPRATLVEPDDPLYVRRAYRPPDRGSGLIAGMSGAGKVKAYTCRSFVLFSTVTGEYIEEDVAPEERAMFDRLVDEITIR